MMYLSVKTRNSMVLNERITNDNMAQMINYHKLLGNILIQHLPIEMIYHICNFIY